MFKMCRILNKTTNQMFNGQIDTELEGNPEYELVAIPNDGKEYIWNGHQVIEKPVDVEALRALGLAYYAQKTNDFRAIPIKYPEGANGFTITLSNNSTVEVFANLSEKFIGYLVTILATAGDTKEAKLTKVSDGLSDVFEIDAEEVTRIHTFISQQFKALQRLDSKIENKILTASNELIIALSALSTEQKDQFSAAIMQNWQAVISMTDEEFDNYINSLIGAA